MAKLTCKCGNTYFKKVVVNEFHNYSGHMYGTLPEVDVDSNIILYECINNECRKIVMPTLDYNTPQADRDLAKKLDSVVKGDVSVLQETLPRGRRPRPGEVTRQENLPLDPSQHGRFVRT